MIYANAWPKYAIDEKQNEIISALEAKVAQLMNAGFSLSKIKALFVGSKTRTGATLSVVTLTALVSYLYANEQFEQVADLFKFNQNDAELELATV